jgi:hypothetical protein
MEDDIQMWFLAFLGVALIVTVIIQVRREQRAQSSDYRPLPRETAAPAAEPEAEVPPAAPAASESEPDAPPVIRPRQANSDKQQ